MELAKGLLQAMGPLTVVDHQLLAGGVPLNDTTELVDTVLEKTLFGCTLFLGNTRIATNASAANETKRALGTKSNDEVKRLVFLKGGVFRGITHTIGKDWVIRYDPLQNEDGAVVGMIAVFREAFALGRR